MSLSLEVNLKVSRLDVSNATNGSNPHSEKVDIRGNWWQISHFEIPMLRVK